MELIDINTQDKIIYQHNAITSGRYDYSACMLDILFMILSGLETGKREYLISAKEIELITGRIWNYQQLRTSTEMIGSRMFEIETAETYKQLWLFSYVEYLKGMGTFKVKINEEALPFFFELKNNFTSMQLKSVLNCSSKYAKRLYALACQWRSIGKKRFEILELKKMLGLINKKGEEQFERISAFKSQVLDIARKQINENTDIKFDYELTKKGRSFYWITIYIDTQKFKHLEINFEKPLEIQKFAGKLRSYGFTEEQASIISLKEKESDFDMLIADLNQRVRQGKLNINNAIAYLIGIYQKKGILPTKG
jgi:replicase